MTLCLLTTIFMNFLTLLNRVLIAVCKLHKNKTTSLPS